MTMLELTKIRPGQTKRCSSWDRTGRNRDCWVIKPGETAVLADIRGPGVITHLWMTQFDGYRECLLRITWDDAPAPSIVCPLGDFFGLGNNLVNSYQSYFFSASTNENYRLNKGCALNCYLAMPFRKRAKVELINESAQEHGQFFYIDYERTDKDRLAESGYLHAEFRRANPFRGWGRGMWGGAPYQVPNKEKTAWHNNYVILETKGRGHYVGCNMSVTNLEGVWWGEGDDMIWVDGYKWPPDLHGTGTEDFFNQAWCMQPNAFLRNGSSLHERFTGGYQTSYVFHVENPVRFQREIKVSIEAGHANHMSNDIASVAYWYAETPTRVVAPPPLDQRLPIVRNEQTGAWRLPRGVAQQRPKLKITPPMRRALRQWAATEGKRARWRSSFVQAWHCSRLCPKAGASVETAPGARLDDPSFGWKHVYSSGGFLDIHDRFAGEDGMVYFGTRIVAAQAGDWRLLLGRDGAAAVDVDGQRVICAPRRINPAEPDRDAGLVHLTKGAHEIVVVFDTDHGLGWGVFLRFEAPRRQRKTNLAFPQVVTDSQPVFR